MLCFKKEQLTEIIEHCQKTFPKEACGILAGKNKVVEKVYYLQNTAEDQLHCYWIDPREQLKLFKEIREQQLELMAIYHSHTFTIAYPSPKDVELAYYPESSYIIVSLLRREDPVIRSFRIIDGKIKEEEIKII